MRILDRNVNASSRKLQHIVIDTYFKTNDRRLIGISRAFRSECPLISSLTLKLDTRANEITEQSFKDLAKTPYHSFSSIKHFYITLAYNDISARGLAALSKSLCLYDPDLETIQFTVSKCNRVNDAVLMAIGDVLCKASTKSKLNRLDFCFSGCESITDHGISVFIEALNCKTIPLQRLKLNLSDIMNFSTLGMPALSNTIGQYLPNLRHWNLILLTSIILQTMI